MAQYLNEDSFQITLPSNSSLSEFPGNKPNSYKTRLQKTLHLELNEWEFALVDVQYPQKYLNLLESCSFGVAIRPEDDEARYRLGQILQEGEVSSLMYNPSPNKDVLDKILMGEDE